MIRNTAQAKRADGTDINQLHMLSRTGEEHLSAISRHLKDEEARRNQVRFEEAVNIEGRELSVHGCLLSIFSTRIGFLFAVQTVSLAHCFR
jgi:hypothetical protein